MRGVAGMPRAVWFGAALSVLVVAGYFGFHALFVKVGHSLQQPFSGPAQYNDFYVLQRFFEQRGLSVHTVRNWPQPLADDALVLWFSHEDVPNDLRTWLSAGGKLWSNRDPDQAPPAANTWLETPFAGDEVPPECPDGCLQAAQFRYGAGCLTLVRTSALENEFVSLGDTPARVDALLKCGVRPRSVWIVTQLDSPWFGTLLLTHAPQALFAFAVLLALKLWRAAKHFGPTEAPRARERRQMLEHISAVGMLASRVGVAPLVTAARRELRKQLQMRLPQATGSNDQDFVSAVARSTDIPLREVQRALLDPFSGGAQETLALARAMQALWRKT